MTSTLIVGADSAQIDQLNRELLSLDIHAESISSPADIARQNFHQITCVILVNDSLSDNVLETLDHLPVSKCIVVDLEANARTAVAAMKRGVADYLIAPYPIEILAKTIEGLAEQSKAKFDRSSIVGDSKLMTEIFELIAFAGPRDTSILIQGETGTGKEMVGIAIHQNSKRNNAALMSLNCGTTPQQLIEHELFGDPNQLENKNESPQNGLLVEADGGSLVLDEVSALPIEVQTRLYAVLSSGKIEDIATGELRGIDTRIIATTQADLEMLIEKGLFDEGLYSHLNLITIPLPPLRARGNDIFLLAQHFAKKTAEKLGAKPKTFSESATKALLAYDWPGNVRELENAVERAVIISGNKKIGKDLLAIDPQTASDSLASLEKSDKTSLEDYFLDFVTTNQDDLTETQLAEKLGISRKSLWERRQRLNIPRKLTKKRGPRRNPS
ncbi:MAG: response regulator [Gammaproteobacteria bacterium]|nr:response regulator [Gammaproteobacteria bacterium]